MFKKLGRIAAVTALSLGMALGLGYRAEAMVAGKPVIGISWESTDQERDYAPIKKIIEMAGGIPVELGQIKSSDVQYDKNGAVDKTCLEPSGMLKQKYADKIKDQNFGNTNIATVMQGIDGVFGTGGEDISPSLYKHPEKEKNHGEEINATRDISDYTLQAYCLKNNIPTLNVCRSEQMMGIVSGVKFMQDIPDYYKAHKKSYDNLHRMPPGTPNRDYTRHDVRILPVQSHLRAIVGKDELKNISSWHHQNIESLAGTALIQTAETTDNGISLIEGIEYPANTFSVGLQFHPENDLTEVLIKKKDKEKFCDTEICMGFFKALVKASAK